MVLLLDLECWSYYLFIYGVSGQVWFATSNARLDIYHKSCMASFQIS